MEIILLSIIAGALGVKLVVDLGLVGLPNAGKSTLLSKITSAKPRIASFPFTTKSPGLGIAKAGESGFVIADIPGLIEGAHAGRGLGDRFLRHIERTGLLIHIVDMAASDGRDPAASFEKLNEELALYDEALSRKKQIVVANKMDLPAAKKLIKNFRPKGAEKVYRISALTGEGIEELLEGIALELKEGEG